jgi:hypothetical protein
LQNGSHFGNKKPEKTPENRGLGGATDQWRSESGLPAKIELAQARAGSSRREESRLIWRSTFFW